MEKLFVFHLLQFLCILGLMNRLSKLVDTRIVSVGLLSEMPKPSSQVYFYLTDFYNNLINNFLTSHVCNCLTKQLQLNILEEQILLCWLY